MWFWEDRASKMVVSGKKKNIASAIINTDLQKHMGTNKKYKWKKQWTQVTFLVKETQQRKANMWYRSSDFGMHGKK